MIKKIAVIANRAGIHVRPSGIIALELRQFKGSVRVCQVSDGHSDLHAPSEPSRRSAARQQTVCETALDLIAMGLTAGTKIEIEVDGENEAHVAEKLVALFETEFDFPPRSAVG